MRCMGAVYERVRGRDGVTPGLLKCDYIDAKWKQLG